MVPATGVQLDAYVWITSLAGSLALSGAAPGQFGSSSFGLTEEDAPHARMRLATERASLVPGVQDVAVVFSIDEDWHLYWRNPGETGLPPEVTLTLPDGVEFAGEMRWPAPARYLHGGGEILDYIYTGEVALLVPVRVDGSLVGSTVTIGASGTWLVCREACLPGEGEASIEVGVSERAGEATADAGVIRASRARSPIEGSGDASVRAGWSGRTLVVEAPGAERLELFPVSPALGGPVDAASEGSVMGPVMRVRYGEGASGAAGVEVVVGAVFDGQERYVRLRLAASERGG